METFIFEQNRDIKEIKRAQEELEEKLNIKITIEGKKVTIEGDAFKEYEARQILEAIFSGFTAKQALILKNENYQFNRINIKHVTKRKNLKDVKARIIGTEGKTKRTIENISNTDIVIRNNEVGIISPVETMEEAVTAIEILIKGSKQANVYKYLEKRNAERKKQAFEDRILKKPSRIKTFK